MTSPSVSVILPTYNRAELLPRAIHSVLNQSYGDLEVIVVDDCSTDATEATLSRLREPRLRIVRLPANSGPGAARNAGIRAALGRYIAFQDSDAEWLPEKLLKQVELLEADHPNGTKAAACYSRFVRARGKRRWTSPPDSKDALMGNIYPRLLSGNTMDTPTLLVKREVLDATGYFDESMPNLEDWDLALRISAGRSVTFLDEVSVVSYDSPGSVNKIVTPASQIIILNKHRVSYREFPQAMARITWCIGVAYAKLGQRASALQFMQMSLDAFPTPSRRFISTAMKAGVNPFPVVHYARKTLRP